MMLEINKGISMKRIKVKFDRKKSVDKKWKVYYIWVVNISKKGVWLIMKNIINSLQNNKIYSVGLIISPNFLS